MPPPEPASTPPSTPPNAPPAWPSTLPSAPPDHSMVVESAWRDQAIWSDTAGRLRLALARWRAMAAVGGVLGVMLIALAGAPLTQGADWDSVRAALSVAGALLLALVPYVQTVKASSAKVSAWTRARSASEALKEAIYRHLMAAPLADAGVSPGTVEGTEPADAPRRAVRVPGSAAALVHRCQAIKQNVADLSALAASSAPVLRQRPLTLTPADYLRTRVNDQIDSYYTPKAQQSARIASRLRATEFVLGLLAVVLGALLATPVTALPRLQAVLGTLTPWVGVVATATTAVTAHLAAAKHEHTATLFFATAGRLRGLRDEWLTDPDRDTPERVLAFVDSCEHAISAETEGWLADWTKAGG